MGGPTLNSVAQRAGVSLATASRVLNGSNRKPAEQVSERVRRAAVELGYTPNAQAQALARSVSGLIGLVVHDIADPYFSTIARGVQTIAHARNRQVLLAGTDPSGELEAVSTFIAHRTDAIVLAGSRNQETDRQLNAALLRYTSNKGRVVAIAGDAGVGGTVPVANSEAAGQLVHELVHRGIRRYSILGGPPPLKTARDRVNGFVAALDACGLSPLAVLDSSFAREGGYTAAVEHLRRFGSHPDMCLLAVNDVMALGAITALRERGVRTPGDIQISGFDDIPTLRDSSPGLTTVRLPLEGIGESAALMALGETDTIEPFRGEVVIRESAGAANPPPDRAD